jgi:hypothetical protein
MRLSVSAVPSFSKAVQCLAFPTPTQANSARCSDPPHRQRGNNFLHVFGHQFCPERCDWLPSCARICGSFPNSVLCSPGGLVDSLGWKQISYRAVQAGSRQRFCACLCLVGPGLPRCLQLSLCASLCCIIVGKVADTLRQREICTVGGQSEVLCTHISWQVQVLPNVCRSLPFSALCFSFTDPGRRELREREKEKKEKKQWGLVRAIWPCCCQLFPASK